MANVSVRIILNSETGLPQDAVVNTFAAIAPIDTEIQVGDLASAFIAFYRDDTPTGGEVQQLLSNALASGAGAARIELYEINLGTGLMGTPFYVNDFPITQGGSAEDLLPNEVAICSSFGATAPPGVNPQRRRGRVFVGPLKRAACVPNAQTGQPEVSDYFLDTIVEATERLALELIDIGATLCVWSRKDAVLTPVTRGWVDREFDTQRRRGNVAQSRTTWQIGS